MASVLITTQEPQVTLTRRGHPVKFLLDTGATFSSLLCNPGPPSTKSATKGGISGKPITKLFTQRLSCNWDSLFSHVYMCLCSVMSTSLTLRPPNALRLSTLSQCLLLCQCVYVSSDNSSPSVKQEPTKALKEVPLPATLGSMVFPFKELRETG